MSISCSTGFEPRRGRGGHLLRAVGGEAFCGFLRGAAQRLERAALELVRVGDAGNVVEGPVNKFRTPLGAAAH